MDCRFEYPATVLLESRINQTLVRGHVLPTEYVGVHCTGLEEWKYMIQVYLSNRGSTSHEEGLGHENIFIGITLGSPAISCLARGSAKDVKRDETGGEPCVWEDIDIQVPCSAVEVLVWIYLDVYLEILDKVPCVY